MMSKLAELVDKYKDFGYEFQSFLLECRIATNQIAILWKIIDDMPIAVVGSTAYTTESKWLEEGELFASRVQRVKLIDKIPYYNDMRRIWYFFCRHGDNEFGSSRGVTDVPSSWILPSLYDRVDNSKPYHDALPLGGWNSSESASEALGKGALAWARAEANK